MIYSLLESVQLLLSSMDSDEVNSINDTIESKQLALLLKSAYYDCASEIELNENKGLFQLNSSGDASLPVYMTIPQGVTKIETIRYDSYDPDIDQTTNSNYKLLEPVDFDTFIRMMTNYHNETQNVSQMSFEFDNQTFNIMYRNDRHPEFYTTLNDRIVLFDSVLSTLDTTLQSSKTMCTGWTYPEFIMEDTFTPNLNPTQFSYFLNYAKGRAFSELKQANNQEAAGVARRQKIILQKRKERSPDLAPLSYAPKFGRK